MALVKNNDLTDGLSGKLGSKIVFRQIKGVTLATRRPVQNEALSEAQIAHRLRFKNATRYAKGKMLDPASKALYGEMASDNVFSSAFTAAVRDYLLIPKVLDINVSEYTGVAGSILPITVSDNVKVIKVIVSIADTGGTVLETGDATYTPGDMEWKYITRQPLALLLGTKITVKATDRPGNEATFEKILA